MLSVIIITLNEEKMLTAAIKSAQQVADEIVVADSGSQDQTVAIAQSLGAKIINSTGTSFSGWRDQGAAAATGDWLFYLDADERITPQLATELKQIMQNPDAEAGYIVQRKDFYFSFERPLSSPMHRLFKKSALQGWQGTLHETPELAGSVGQTDNWLVHLTHTNLTDMIAKTNKWKDKEAKLRFDANHPPVVWWRLIRVFITGFYDSYVKQEGYKCGTAGWIEAIYQGCSMFFTYARLWELQNQKTIEQNYQKLDSQFRT